MSRQPPNGRGRLLRLCRDGVPEDIGHLLERPATGNAIRLANRPPARGATARRRGVLVAGRRRGRTPTRSRSMPVASPESGLSHNASAVDIRIQARSIWPGKQVDRPELHPYAGWRSDGPSRRRWRGFHPGRDQLGGHQPKVTHDVRRGGSGGARAGSNTRDQPQGVDPQMPSDQVARLERAIAPQGQGLVSPDIQNSAFNPVKTRAS